MQTDAPGFSERGMRKTTGPREEASALFEEASGATSASEAHGHGQMQSSPPPRAERAKAAARQAAEIGGN